jgi:flagellar hook-associated protein 1 FlgK
MAGISTFLGVETALRGLLASQRALDVTGHNIANANTEGYSRQQVQLETTSPYLDAGKGLVGTGVDVTSYTRQRDQFIDIQLRAQSMQLGQSEARQDGLQQVESNLNEPSDSGISSLLQKYWSSWQDVANAPESVPARQALVQNAQTLASSIQDLNGRVATIAGQNDTNIGLTVDEVNSLSSRIAQLNKSISAAGLQNTGSPNDLLDQRDNLLDRLAQLGNLSWTANAANDGTIDVTLGGTAIVAGQTATALSNSPAALGTSFSSLSSGKLKALSDLRTTDIPGYQSQLNSFAASLASATNAQHALGYDLSGTAGGAFFSVTAGSEASTIAVVATASTVAASSAAGGAVGNGSNALAQGVSDAGGLGLAQQLYDSMAQKGAK